MYSDNRLLVMNDDLHHYEDHLKSKKYTSKQLWDMKYGNFKVKFF